MCSAAATEFDSGAFTTRMPRFVAASMSTLSTPVPARPTTLRFGALAIRSAVTFVAERTISASNSPIRSSSAASSQPNPSSTSKCSRRSATPESAIFSFTSTFRSAASTTPGLGFASLRLTDGPRARLRRPSRCTPVRGLHVGRLHRREHPDPSWFRPSLRYGSVSTISFARRVAASAAASTSASKSIVPTTSDRFAGPPRTVPRSRSPPPSGRDARGGAGAPHAPVEPAGREHPVELVGEQEERRHGRCVVGLVLARVLERGRQREEGRLPAPHGAVKLHDRAIAAGLNSASQRPPSEAKPFCGAK